MKNSNDWKSILENIPGIINGILDEDLGLNTYE